MAGNNRRQARYRLVQSLYQWSLTQDPTAVIKDQRVETDGNLDVDYYNDVFEGVTQDVERLDALLAPHTERPLSACDPVEVAILRMAAYELTSRIDVPYKVVINEAVELAKKLGAEESYKFVNGVLDSLRDSERA